MSVSHVGSEWHKVPSIPFFSYEATKEGGPSDETAEPEVPCHDKDFSLLEGISAERRP